jgi:hypothetical protein
VRARSRSARSELGVVEGRVLLQERCDPPLHVGARDEPVAGPAGKLATGREAVELDLGDVEFCAQRLLALVERGDRPIEARRVLSHPCEPRVRLRQSGAEVTNRRIRLFMHGVAGGADRLVALGGIW